MRIYTHCLPVILLFLQLACHTPKPVASQKGQEYTISGAEVDSNSALALMLKPYRDSLDINMNEVIGHATADFSKEPAGGSLGRLILDAMEDRIQKSGFGHPITGSVYNPGGIRLPGISKGSITRAKLYELLPFDNELVVVAVKGEVLQQWVSHMGSNGGWPNTLRKGRPAANEMGAEAQRMRWEPDSTFYVLTNDYIANGGDQCSFLLPCKKFSTGLLIRDIVIDYVGRLNMISPFQP